MVSWTKRGGYQIRAAEPDTHEVFLELRGARLERNVSAKTLGKTLGMDPSTILKGEIGKGNPPFDTLLSWATALGYEIVLVKKGK